MDTFLYVLQVLFSGILALTVLVFIHELGHFLPAKWFGMRAEKFYIFMDWPRKLWSKKHKGTEFGIGVLPIGGYVKIAGMIDESFDVPDESKPPEPWEFRAKPVWQRAIVMVGGVTMNVLLAIVIFSILAMGSTIERVPIGGLKYGVNVLPNSIGSDLGFKDGDVPLSFKGEEFTHLPSDIQQFVIASDGYFTVQRGEEQVRLDVPNDYINKLSDADAEDAPLPVIFQPNTAARVNEVAEGSPAEKAGLQPGDEFISFQGQAVPSFGHLQDLVAGAKGQAVSFAVLRGADTLQMNAQLDSTGILGFTASFEEIPVEREKLGFFAAIGAGASRSFQVGGSQAQGFGKLVSGDVDVDKGLSGPVRIFQIIGGALANGWPAWWATVALLSMVLAFVNILPIPALDGGHLVFLLIEGITGKEPSTKVRLVAQQVGFLLLMGLMVFVIFNDIRSFF